MNLTLTHPKQAKQTFIHLTTLAPQTVPQVSPSDRKPNLIKRQQCGQLFFVNCLNGNPTQPSEMSDVYQVLQLYKQPESKLDDKAKRKISLSITHKNQQRFHTPRQGVEEQQQSLGKPTFHASPIRMKQKTGEISRIKLTLNSTLTPEVKNKGEQQFCESKQTMTRNSLEPVQSQGRCRQTQKALTFITANTTSNWQITKVQHSSQKKIIRFTHQIPIHNLEEKYSVVQKSQISQRKIDHDLHQESHQPIINWKQRLKEKRCIGEYAKTIKTFNASEPKQNDSQIQSIVLEKGLHHFHQSGRMVTPLNRGSIKEYPVEEETLRRGYGSVGEELHRVHLDSRFKYIDQAIQEDLYDSEI